MITRIEEKIIRFIADYYKENTFYPNYDEIAAGVGRAKASIYTHMKKLEKEGIIIRKCDGSSQYRLLNVDFINKDKEAGVCDGRAK